MGQIVSTNERGWGGAGVGSRSTIRKEARVRERRGNESQNESQETNREEARVRGRRGSESQDGNQ